MLQYAKFSVLAAGEGFERVSIIALLLWLVDVAISLILRYLNRDMSP